MGRAFFIFVFVFVSIFTWTCYIWSGILIEHEMLNRFKVRKWHNNNWIDIREEGVWSVLYQGGTLSVPTSWPKKKQRVSKGAHCTPIFQKISTDQLVTLLPGIKDAFFSISSVIRSIFSFFCGSSSSRNII